MAALADTGAEGLSYDIEETMESTGHSGGVIRGPVEATVPYLLAEEAIGQMDRFAEMSLAGRNAAAALPLVHDHLQRCGDCREEFETLLAALRV